MKFIEVLDSCIFSLPTRQIKGPGFFQITKDESGYIVQSVIKFRFISEDEYNSSISKLVEKPIIEPIIKEEVEKIKKQKPLKKKTTKDILGTGSEVESN